MASLIGILAIVCGIGSLVCWIMVLVAMFKANQIWQGVVGIICGLFAFIWGWVQAGQLGVQKVMLVWTVLILLGIVLNVMVAGMTAGAHNGAAGY